MSPFFQPPLLKHFSWSSITGSLLKTYNWLHLVKPKEHLFWCHASKRHHDQKGVLLGYTHILHCRHDDPCNIKLWSSSLKNKPCSSCCCQTLTLPQPTGRGGGHLCNSIWGTSSMRNHRIQAITMCILQDQSVMHCLSSMCFWDISVQARRRPLEETAFWMSGTVICVLGWPVKGF